MILLGPVAITIVSIVGYMAWQDRNTTPMIQGSSSLVVENSASTASTTSSTEETSTSSEATESSSTTESSEAKMTMTASDSTQSSITITMKDAENPIELAFTGLDASCWVGVQVDNAYVYQYTVQAGETQSMTLPEGATNATLTLGASQNISITANGQEVDFSDPQFELLQKTVRLVIEYQDDAA